MSRASSSSSSVASMFSPHEFDYPVGSLSISSYLDSQPMVTEAQSMTGMEVAPPSEPAVASRRTGRGGPGGKGSVRISMGYRADCDKCVRRVVGHYSHVVGEDGVVQVDLIGGAGADARAAAGTAAGRWR